MLRRLALRRKRAFDCGKAPLEFLVGLPQQRLGIGVQMAGEIDCGKEQVAHFRGRLIWIRFQRRLDLVGLFANFTQHSADVVPVEPDFAGFALQL